ncbi:Adenylyl cyclase-associated protein 1 [Smittium mucronatum]|uniref:Adenylyl cyclase-associated protein n=1 Tax=Smittium mucronatum TaxID=133383 RepID=A0A1R0GXS4_9FUNG|nr:Adenylyl cyclase-associated protein 1 [Smittium mucronatum]
MSSKNSHSIGHDFVSRIKQASNKITNLAAETINGNFLGLEGHDSHENHPHSHQRTFKRPDSDDSNVPTPKITQVKEVEEYSKSVVGAVDELIVASQKLDSPVVVGIVTLLAELANHEKNFIQVASQMNKPNPEELQLLLSHIQVSIESVMNFKYSNRMSRLTNNLNAVAEGVAAFGWVAVDKDQLGYITEMKQSSLFYTNRILKEFRASNPAQVEFVDKFLNVLDQLFNYVKIYHTVGLQYGYSSPLLTIDQALAYLIDPTIQQTSTDSVNSSVSTVTPSAPAGDSANYKSSGTAGVNALFSEINQGEGITHGLKKVDLNATRSADLPASASASSAPRNLAAGAPKPQSPPIKELQGKRWVVENFVDSEVTVEVTDITQTCYIFNCTGCTVVIVNKVNNLTVDKCLKTSVVFDAVVSSCDVVNSQSVKVQANFAIPLINVDKSNGVQIFLNDSNKENVEILTAKSSEINVCYTDETSEDAFDYREFFIPEQMKTKVINGKLNTVVLDHSH